MLTLEIRGSKQSEYLYEPDSFVPLAKLESAAHVQRPEHKAINPKKVASLFKATPSDSEQNEAPAHASQAQAAIETEVEATTAKAKDFAVFYYQCDQIGAPQELTDEQGNIVWAATPAHRQDGQLRHHPLWLGWRFAHAGDQGLEAERVPV